ncbi:MAG: hypothetical protein IPP94_17790 [Ignavibacteria bacterium]|nr:hypothetical protein [Ignavibacteria bacterium]
MTRMAARTLYTALFCCIVGSLSILPGCSEDSSSAPPATVDYFPFSRNYVWNFRTNIFATKGVADTTFQLKIDTATHRNGPVSGLYWWYFARLSAPSQRWDHFLVLLDSANTIYSWGDFPSTSNPPTPPFSFGWKHQYGASEGTRETITVQGKSYSAVRVDFTGEQDVHISWWFADGIGLIREYSAKGGSIFTDDNWGDDVVMSTELVSYSK